MPLRPFRYLADPVCIASLVIYAINRSLLKPRHIGGWFTHGYLNDVLCLPMFVPITLYVAHIIGVRKGDRFPHIWEIIECWMAFVVVFQLVTPRFPGTFITAGDPWDILAYAVGGIIAGAIWAHGARGSIDPPRRITIAPRRQERQDAKGRKG